WDAAAPFLFTREDARQPDFRIKVVADISCDIDGPVASTIRPSTIADPIYGYNPQTETEGDFQQDSNLTVMAVDNLPCELPRDASEDFGAELLGHILPALLGDDSETIIERATIARGGALTPLFHYLQDYVNG
ncbi:MAG: alanine dehydrogenase, partial [Bacteroidota bacterium]